MFCSFFFYDNFNDLCFPFNCSSPFLPLSAPYLQASLAFIFNSYSFLLGCHSSYTETFTSTRRAWPDPSADLGCAHKKETRGFWLSCRDPNQASTVLSICSSCAFPVWEPLWSQLWCNWCTFYPLCAHFATFFTAPKKQRNWRGPGSVPSHSVWSNGITAETKVMHSLALMFGLKFLFKSWIILQCIIRFLLAGFSACFHA